VPDPRLAKEKKQCTCHSPDRHRRAGGPELAAAAAPALHIVAVGDSYASGEGAIGAGWASATCHRSSLAGPQDAAARLDTLRPTTFTSLARFASHGYCTGGGSPVPWAVPNPRFISTPVDSLTSQNDLGGVMHPNDLGQRAIGAALYEATRFLTAVIAPVPDHPVPDVRGDTATQARSALAAAGLAVDQRTVADPTCERVGTVISQSPAAGTRPQTPCP
jgi:PASTA domain